MTVTDETSEYNQIAIETAARLHEFRRTDARSSPRTGRPLEQLLPPARRTAVGVKREWERMGERPVSADLQDRADALGARFEHLGLTLGTVIHDVDLTDPHADLVSFIRATLLERKVVFFRDQHLTEDEQVAFGRRFGGLDAFPFGKPGENPYTLEITHGPAGPGTENGWHTDVTWMERPSLGSTAQLIVKPPVGGDTLFADSHAAYLGLSDARTGVAVEPEESRAIVDALLARHGRPQYVCRFPWEVGSIAFWDNRAVQHYAASDYFPHHRVLRRVTVSGDRPFHRPDADS